MIGSQLVENTWCFKPITFEESVTFMIKLGFRLMNATELLTPTNGSTQPYLVASTMASNCDDWEFNEDNH